jgi:hypothetical protein
LVDSLLFFGVDVWGLVFAASSATFAMECYGVWEDDVLVLHKTG